MSYSLSKKQILSEVVKCGRSPQYFIDNYAKITHPQRGLIPFHTYDFQKDLLEDFKDHRFNVILKARQLGISTVTAAYIVWMMLFHREKNVLVIATKFSTAANLVKKVKAILRSLPEWIMIANVSIDNRTSFELSNGSQIKASSTSGDAGRSEALSLLVIDEAAHVEGLSELWMGLYPLCLLVVGASHYLLQMVSETGFTKHIQSQSKVQTTLSLQSYCGMSTQKEIYSGSTAKLKICRRVKLPKNWSAILTCLVKRFFTQMT